MPKIFIINMDSSVDRKNNCVSQLDPLDLDYEFFTAIDGRTTPKHPLLKHYSSTLSYKYRGQYLSDGQLGCFASHYSLWEICVKENQPIIVLEDDVKIYTPEFLSFVENIEHLPDDIECVRLFENKKRGAKSKFKIKCGNVDIHQFSKGHMSATGYYLTPNAAKKFLDKANSWYLPVDIFMDRFWCNDVICYGTHPACLTNDLKFDSDIGYMEKKYLTPKGKIHREVNNLYSKIKETMFNIKHF